MTDTTPSFPSRRAALKAASSGFGYLAFAGLSTWAAERERPTAAAGPLAPKPPHFPARAKRVIFLFMEGGPSHVDTFDHKPRLKDRRRPAVRRRVAAAAKLLPSPSSSTGTASPGSGSASCSPSSPSTPTTCA